VVYNGFDVLFARTGAEGLRFAQEYEPDLVLLDLGLPEIDGLEDLIGPAPPGAMGAPPDVEN
jgi:DNA-binding response OmpR family regulator